MTRGPRIGTLLKKASLADLRAAIDSRRKEQEGHLRELVRTRKTLQGRLDALNAEIATCEASIRGLPGGAPKRQMGRPLGSKNKPKAAVASNTPGGSRRSPGRPSAGAATGARRPGRPAKVTRRRGRQRPSVRELAVEVLREAGGAMHQKDIARVLIDKKGVTTKNKNFDRSLGLLMSEDPRFKRVDRAVYTLV